LSNVVGQRLGTELDIAIEIRLGTELEIRVWVRVRVLGKTLWKEVVRGAGPRRRKIVTVGCKRREGEGGSHGGNGRIMRENLGRRRWWQLRLRCGVTE
jgi:hypothetical protein